MGTNRKLPFGYKMEYGKVVIDPTEKHWVLHLYERYDLGVTIRELTDFMNNTGVRYEPSKPWNKNMVARILADTRYLGGNGYPQIVCEEQFHAAEEKRKKKAPAVQKIEAQKILRKKCDRAITPHIESEVLCLMNRLAANPNQIRTPKPPTQQSRQLETPNTELEDLLQNLPVDEERARAVLQQIAVAEYERIDSREYETYRMQRVFRKEQPGKELDTRLIAITISAVLVDSNGKVKIKLKNDQVIERGE